MKDLRQTLKGTDIVFLIICGVCSAMSVLSLYAIYSRMSLMKSISTVFVQRFASVLGIIIAVVISFIDYRELCEQWKLHSALAYGLMIYTAVFGYSPPGTTNKAWISLPFGLSLQSSEVLKISAILTLALILEKYRNQINEVKILAKLVLFAVVPLAFVAFQRDGGTLIVFCFIVACMFFVRGVSYKVVALGACTVAVALPVMWFKGIIDDYQKNRILALFNPEKFQSIMWQQNQGKIAIGSGQILGKGFLVDNHNSTPLAYNDFIFSFIAESVGFVGTVMLLLMILFLWFKILSIAKRSRDLRGTLICTGIFGMLMAQTIINLGMNLSLMPVIGVTFPLFSAGGTSVLVTYVSIGLVLSVARHNPKTLFN